MTLLSRVAKLEGADREVDAEIALFAGDYKLRERDGKWAVFDAPFEKGKWAAASGCSSEHNAIMCLSTFRSLPAYTASIDAAIALVESVRPGAWYSVAKGRMKAAEPLYGAYIMFGSDEILGAGESEATPAIALILALLHALQDKGETDVALQQGGRDG